MRTPSRPGAKLLLCAFPILITQAVASSQTILPQPVELRISVEQSTRQVTVDAQVAATVFAGVIFVAGQPRTHDLLGVQVLSRPGYLASGVTFERLSGAFSLDEAADAGKLWIQAVVLTASGDLRASEVKPFDAPAVRDELDTPTRKPAYSGPAVDVGAAIVDRFELGRSTIGLSIAISPHLRAYSLTHLRTLRRDGGTDVYVVLEEPGPRGAPDGTERHDVFVDLGASPGPMRVIVGRLPRVLAGQEEPEELAIAWSGSI